MRNSHQLYGQINHQKKPERLTRSPESFHEHCNSQLTVVYLASIYSPSIINKLWGIQTETYLKMNSVKRNERNKLRIEQENNITLITDT